MTSLPIPDGRSAATRQGVVVTAARIPDPANWALFHPEFAVGAVDESVMAYIAKHAASAGADITTDRAGKAGAMENAGCKRCA
ncbi:MAG: hypothetical protein IPO58_24365 [Betaproteobacteria bacterium]|nr:hypothetical protein [Betaproteobacteria bacterium]